MNTTNEVKDQIINHHAQDENEHPSCSAHNSITKSTFQFYASTWCPKCSGTGYIDDVNHIEEGRCFQCIPGYRWNALLGEYCATGIVDDTGEHVCEIRLLVSDEYSLKGYAVTQVGLPPIANFDVFETYEDALRHAEDLYGI